MSDLLELRTEIEETSAAIARHERALAEKDPPPSVAASMRSLQRIMAQQEANFAEATAEQYIDVCRYRFFAESNEPTIAPICGALLEFQNAYSSAFDAVRTGPKPFGKPSAEASRQSTFGFGYSFAGSVGIVLTFQNSSIKLFETDMDVAMNGVFRLANAKTTGDVVREGKVLGGAAVRAVLSWVRAHRQGGIGLDVMWCKDSEIKDRIVLDHDSIERLEDVLKNTSHTETETVYVVGMLLGGESMTGKKDEFHFRTEDGQDIYGTYTDAISESKPAQWPRRYRAEIVKTVKTFYAGETEPKASYFLVNLTPLPRAVS